MKKYNLIKITLIVISLLFSKYTLSQQTDSITYDNTRSEVYSANFKNGTSFQKYISKDGSVLKLGDSLIIGNPSLNHEFSSLIFGRLSLINSMIVKPTPLTSHYKTEKVVITGIFCYHEKISRASTVLIIMHTRNLSIPELGSYRTILNYEKSIELKEIINPHAAITKEEAINKLKQAKNLLDLGMMSQDDFNALKEKLRPVITK